jgi:hypothetical protein
MYHHKKYLTVLIEIWHERLTPEFVGQFRLLALLIHHKV